MRAAAAVVTAADSSENGGGGCGGGGAGGAPAHPLDLHGLERFYRLKRERAKLWREERCGTQFALSAYLRNFLYMTLIVPKHQPSQLHRLVLP